MPLVQCPDCGQEVSDQAPSCPKCGRPIRATTIEATGKFWKGLQLLSALAAIAGVVALIASGSEKDPGAGAIGFLLLIGGLFGFIIGRIGAWWFHG